MKLIRDQFEKIFLDHSSSILQKYLALQNRRLKTKEVNEILNIFLVLQYRGEKHAQCDIEIN